MARSRYVHKYKAFGDEVLRAGWMVAEMRTRAEAVEALAKAISPVGNARWYYYRKYESAIAPGHYKDSFSVSSGIHGFGGAQRAYGRVTNTSTYAGIVEFGFGRVPKHRVLGRALSAAGSAAAAAK